MPSVVTAERSGGYRNGAVQNDACLGVGLRWKQHTDSAFGATASLEIPARLVTLRLEVLAGRAAVVPPRPERYAGLAVRGSGL